MSVPEPKFTEDRKGFLLDAVEMMMASANRIQHWISVTEQEMKITYFPSAVSDEERLVKETISSAKREVEWLEVRLNNLYTEINRQEPIK